MNVKVKFVKQYTTATGNVFRDYVSQDGRLVSVRMRTERSGLMEYTNKEATAEAVRRLTAN